MAEGSPTVEDRVMGEIRSLREAIQAWREDTDVRLSRLEDGSNRVDGRLSRLEGGFEQMDRRLLNVEQLQRWALGLVITSWVTLAGLILAKMP